MVVHEMKNMYKIEDINAYILPKFNIATVGFGDYIYDAFSLKVTWVEYLEISLLMSAGAALSYHSFLRSINFDPSYDINKVRLFFSIGSMFNTSNKESQGFALLLF